jgi:peptidoglycan hydrolase-like protein with peptidoglycan-binding domain
LIQCYGQGIPQDGDYGGRTRDAVKNVQRFHGFVGDKIDGVYGPKTRNVMAFPQLDAAGHNLGCWL